MPRAQAAVRLYEREVTRRPIIAEFRAVGVSNKAVMQKVYKPSDITFF